MSEMLSTDSYIVDNSNFIGYPSDYPYEMYTSGNCTKGFWSPKNKKYQYEICTDCDNRIGMSGSSIMNIIKTKDYKMPKSRGVINYLYDNYFNGGVAFIHGGPHIPSILQWTNLTNANKNK
jgi:V8-like Glu-specific endopeptidase